MQYAAAGNTVETNLFFFAALTIKNSISALAEGPTAWSTLYSIEVVDLYQICIRGQLNWEII